MVVFFFYSVFGFIFFGITMIVLKYVIKSAVIEAHQELKAKNK